MKLFLVQIEPKVLELPAPLGLRIAQALDVDAAREAAFDRCLDELGSKERERQRQIDLAHRASFAPCQLRWHRLRAKFRAIGYSCTK